MVIVTVQECKSATKQVVSTVHNSAESRQQMVVPLFRTDRRVCTNATTMV